MAFDDRRGNNHRNKQDSNKYQERNGNYSPSARYLFGGNSQPPQHVQHQNQPHRRERDQYNKHAHHFDRIVKQNDVMIRLLKEIRDKLDELGRGSGTTTSARADETAAAVGKVGPNGKHGAKQRNRQEPQAVTTSEHDDDQPAPGNAVE